MKKFTAIILAITCAFALFSCEKDDNKKVGIEDSVKSVAEMYESSNPTKIVTKISNKIGDNRSYDGEYTLVTGEIGGKIATVYTWWYEELRAIEDGSGTAIVGPESKVEGSKEFLEDKGVRENGGKWNANAYNFAPVAGETAVNLAFANLISPVYENNTLTFSVAPDKAIEVLGVALGVDGEYDFGEEGQIKGDIAVSITNAGNVITGITVSYTQSGVELEDGNIDLDLVYPDVQVTVSVTYEYDLQKITLTK